MARPRLADLIEELREENALLHRENQRLREDQRRAMARPRLADLIEELREENALLHRENQRLREDQRRAMAHLEDLIEELREENALLHRENQRLREDQRRAMAHPRLEVIEENAPLYQGNRRLREDQRRAMAHPRLADLIEENALLHRENRRLREDQRRKTTVFLEMYLLTLELQDENQFLKERLRRSDTVMSALCFRAEALQRENTSLCGQLRRLEEQNRRLLGENAERKEGASRLETESRKKDRPGAPPLRTQGGLGAPTDRFQDFGDQHARPSTSGMGSSRERAICVASARSKSCSEHGWLHASVASVGKMCMWLQESLDNLLLSHCKLPGAMANGITRLFH